MTSPPARSAGGRAREVPDDLGAVLVAARFRGDIDFREKIVFDGNGDPLHSGIPLIRPRGAV